MRLLQKMVQQMFEEQKEATPQVLNGLIVVGSIKNFKSVNSHLLFFFATIQVGGQAKQLRHFLFLNG